MQGCRATSVTRVDCPWYLYPLAVMQTRWRHAAFLQRVLELLPEEEVTPTPPSWDYRALGQCQTREYLAMAPFMFLL